MDHHYTIINQCLQLLKQCDMPTIKKLRVEIQLIQMKRLLLNDNISSGIAKKSCDDDLFEALLGQMRGICNGGYQGEALADLMDRIGGMLTALGGDQTSH